MRLIFTGPDPKSVHGAHSGGQLTATTGFARFAADRGIAIDWVDTLQSNFPLPSLHSRVLRALGRLVRFTALAVRGKADGAILFAGAGMSFVERSVMAVIGRLAGIPVILMIRDGNFHLAYHRSSFFRIFVRFMLHAPTCVGVQGASWKPLLHDAGVVEQRIAVIPNWTDRQPATAPRAIASSGALRLIFVGWLTEAKGIPELLDAMRIVARHDFAATLTLVGGGSLLEACRIRADDPEIGGRIEVSGWLSPEEVAEALDRSDVLILPSHAEGFPNVVMEALTHGLPVIATPVGAVPDSVIDGYNGTIVPVGDSEAIAAAISEYASNRSRISEQSQHALETARSLHDRDINCERLLASLGPRSR